MQPVQYRSNEWMKWPILIIMLVVSIVVGGAALSDTDLLNGISARAAADRVYTETRQGDTWFTATLPLELSKVAAETQDYIARLEENRRVERLNNDRTADTKRLLVLGGVGLLLLSGVMSILLVGLLVGTKILNVVNREEAVHRDYLIEQARVANRPPAAPINRPTPIDVDTPQPLSAVRAGAVRVAKRPVAARASGNGSLPERPGMPEPGSNGLNGRNGSHANHQHSGGATMPSSDYTLPDTPLI